MAKESTTLVSIEVPAHVAVDILQSQILDLKSQMYQLEDQAKYLVAAVYAYANNETSDNMNALLKQTKSVAYLTGQEII